MAIGEKDYLNLGGLSLHELLCILRFKLLCAHLIKTTDICAGISIVEIMSLIGHLPALQDCLSIFTIDVCDQVLLVQFAQDVKNLLIGSLRHLDRATATLLAEGHIVHSLQLTGTVVGNDVTSHTLGELPVLLAVWLGLRRSEIIGLRWEDVDYENGTINIREALVPDENNQFQVKGTKTVKSRRTLPCPQYILDLIRQQERAGDRIVTTPPHTINRRMARAAEKAGVPAIGLHALRHQNASIMLALNIPDKYAMKRGGWSTNKTMKDIYQHTMEEGEQQAAVAIDRYFDDITKTKKPKKYRIVRNL